MSEAGTQLVTVFGGSGFVGRHIVQALARRGYRIRVAVRQPELAGHLQPLGGVGQIHAVQANLRDATSVKRAVDGADAVVNLVGILYQSGSQSFKALHNEGAGLVAQAAKEAGVRKFVQMSAIGADLKAKSNYAASKARGEEKVLAAFPKAVILRPSIIFGPEDDFFNRFADLARVSPVLPLIGGGRTRFQPVYVGDVARAAVAALEGRAKPGEVYELGGPEIVTFRQVLERIGEFTNRNPMLVYVPFFIATLQGFFLGLLPNPMLTVDQVRLLKRDNIVSDAALSEQRTLAGLGIPHPQAAEAVVPLYLERFKPKGQFSHYRV